MKYRVMMQFIPKIDQIWVSRLTPEDPEYVYDVEQDAIDKANELEQADPTGRKYKVDVVVL
jgi:hypothetical protein